jgi:hypothetical protein
MWIIEVKHGNQWEDLGEGPWEAREDAETFGGAEVGVEWRVVRLTLPERIERVVREWDQWSPAERARMDDVVEEILEHCRAGTGNRFIRSWVNRILVARVPGMVAR